MTRKLILIAILSSISQVSFSQEVNLFAKDIKEERHLEQEDSFVELTSVITGLKIDDFNQVKLKGITSATDEDGNILKRVESFYFKITLPVMQHTLLSII